MNFLRNLFFGFVTLAAASAADDEIPDPRDQHYDFAHKTLVAAMEEGDGFLADLEKKKDNLLKSLWRDAGKAAKDSKKVSATGLAFQVFKVDETKTVVVVMLPKPEVTAEAFMVGCVVTKGGKTETVYTLEKSFKGGTVLCSWNDGTHGNFGAGPEAKPELFRDAILKHEATP